jgi:hypothetical protein
VGAAIAEVVRTILERKPHPEMGYRACLGILSLEKSTPSKDWKPPAHSSQKEPTCALAQKACRDGFSVLHKRTSELFRELAVAHADGSIGRPNDRRQHPGPPNSQRLPH